MQIISKFVEFVRTRNGELLFRQGLVEERTGDYLAEKKKAEALLYQLLPA